MRTSAQSAQGKPAGESAAAAHRVAGVGPIDL